MSRKRKLFSCDFETTTDENDCRVWGWGYMELYNNDNYEIGNNMESFMEWALNSKADLYFHNLKFDGSFIVSWLLNNGYEHDDSGLSRTFNTVISDMGQWYMIEISQGYKNGKKMTTKIYDSLKKLPFSVDRIGKAFNLATLKIDVDEEFYRRERPIGHKITDEEYEYIKHDIKVIANALEIQFNQGLTKMTASSDSLANFKAILSKKTYDKYFPTFNIRLDESLRKSYKGGFTWLNTKFFDVEIEGGIVFDVNSLYPSVMYNRLLPFGTPFHYLGEYKEDETYPLFIQEMFCSFVLKEDHVPTIQIKNDLRFMSNEYLESSKGERVLLHVTNVDLELIKKHYDLYDVEYIQGWKFRGRTGLFNQYIDRWNVVKMSETGAMRELAKLMLNSLYGKFATNPNKTRKIPYLDEEGILRFSLGEEEIDKPEYTAMGSFITAYAREETISTAQLCYDRVIYCDTDSLHLTGTDIPEALEGKIDSKIMGKWDFEATFEKGKYLRQKTYAHIIEGELHVTSSGMNEEVKNDVTWDNFKIGFKSSNSRRAKQVKGGVVITNQVFEIKGANRSD